MTLTLRVPEIPEALRKSLPAGLKIVRRAELELLVVEQLFCRRRPRVAHDLFRHAQVVADLQAVRHGRRDDSADVIPRDVGNLAVDNPHNDGLVPNDP